MLGGCSLRGGEGSIIGIIIGTALLQVLQNLVNLLGIPSSLNFAVMGAVIFLGVLVDSISGKRRQKQQALARAPAPTKPAPPTPSKRPNKGKANLSFSPERTPRAQRNSLTNLAGRSRHWQRLWVTSLDE